MDLAQGEFAWNIGVGGHVIRKLFGSCLDLSARYVIENTNLFHDDLSGVERARIKHKTGFCELHRDCDIRMDSAPHDSACVRMDTGRNVCGDDVGTAVIDGRYDIGGFPLYVPCKANPEHGVDDDLVGQIIRICDFEDAEFFADPLLKPHFRGEFLRISDDKEIGAHAFHVKNSGAGRAVPAVVACAADAQHAALAAEFLIFVNDFPGNA